MIAEGTSNVWVTGASSGIGRAIAEQLGKAGHRVYISGRKLVTLEEMANTLEGELIPIACDVSDDDQMAGVLSAAGVESLDTIILSAGTCEYIDLPSLDSAKIRRNIETNFFGVVNSCAAALPLLRKTSIADSKKKPHIIGVGSMSSYLGFPRAEGYGSSKAALSYFLESLRMDLAGEVDVTIVYPGFIKTPMTEQNDFPMPFLMTAEKAAEVILDKAKGRPRTIAFPTRLHLILRTMKMLPGFWYSILGPRLKRQSGPNQ